MLGLITIGSFAAWAIPTHPSAKFVYPDPAARLDQIISRHNAISYEMGFEYSKLLQGANPENYTSTARIASEQVDTLILSIIKTEIPEPWHVSYRMYMDSLRSYSAYLQITISIAEKLKADPDADVSVEIARAAYVLDESAFTIMTSLQARPNS